MIFDETSWPVEWDLITSRYKPRLAGREIGVKKADCEEAVHHLIARYRKYVDHVCAHAGHRYGALPVHRLQRIAPVSTALLESRALHAGAYARSSLQFRPKEKSGQTKKRIFKEQSRCSRALSSAQARAVLSSLHEYTRRLLPERRHFFAQYHPVDVGFKVVAWFSRPAAIILSILEGNGRVIRCFSAN